MNRSTEGYAAHSKGSVRAIQSPETVLKRMVQQEYCDGVIPWSCPVPSFGDYERATVASVGLNPSNREFIDARGCELEGHERRFHTLGSLGIARWADAAWSHLSSTWERCRTYFERSPYDAWFGQLEYLLGDTEASFYGRSAMMACHLDIIPYATWRKWGELSPVARASLLQRCRQALGTVVRNSPVKLLVLNGSSVVRCVEEMSGAKCEATDMPEWSLRSGSGQVRGVAFQGTINELGGVELGRRVTVMGYNHNIQSSFGVTREVRASIRQWLGRTVREVRA